jgi:hypothetical protein
MSASCGSDSVRGVRQPIRGLVLDEEGRIVEPEGETLRSDPGDAPHVSVHGSDEIAGDDSPWPHLRLRWAWSQSGHGHGHGHLAGVWRCTRRHLCAVVWCRADRCTCLKREEGNGERERHLVQGPGGERQGRQWQLIFAELLSGRSTTPSA